MDIREINCAECDSLSLESMCDWYEANQFVIFAPDIVILRFYQILKN